MVRIVSFYVVFYFCLVVSCKQSVGALLPPSDTGATLKPTRVWENMSNTRIASYLIVCLSSLLIFNLFNFLKFGCSVELVVYREPKFCIKPWGFFFFFFCHQCLYFWLAVHVDRWTCRRLHCRVQRCRGGKEGGVSTQDPHQAHLLKPTSEWCQNCSNYSQHARAALTVVRPFRHGHIHSRPH